jgi:hypothetical protein
MCFGVGNERDPSESVFGRTLPPSTAIHLQVLAADAGIGHDGPDQAAIRRDWMFFIRFLTAPNPLP